MSPWILTASGQMFDLQYTNQAHVLLADIAHSLAQINRFTGHARRPYSVAEHSLLVLDIVRKLYPHADVHCHLAALLHDAHEAYVGDMATPTKRLLPDNWPTLEHRVERTVHCAFALHTAMHRWRDVIKQADLIALATERQQLLPDAGATWEVLVHVQPAQWVDLMSPARLDAPWSYWRHEFLTQADLLDHARTDQLFPAKS